MSYTQLKMVKEVTNVEHESSAKNQFLGALVVNMMCLSWGICCGWASPSTDLLMSDKTPLPSGKITLDEASLVAALMCVGALVGNFFFGYLTSRFGRKIIMISLGVPQIIGWLLILFAQNVTYLYASRSLLGFVGGGIFVTVPPFLGEIAVDRVRGVLGSTVVLTSNLGILTEFIFGAYLDFFVTPKFVIGLTILCSILLCFFPDSPSFLVQQNKISEAEKAIQFYHNIGKSDQNYAQIRLKISKLQSALGGDDKEKANENSLKLSDFTSGAGKNAMIIGIVLAAFNQLSGCFAMLQYTAKIFAEAGSNMHPNTAAIVVGVIQLFGSYVATVLVDRAGRKILYLISSVGIALGLITLGVYMLCKQLGLPVETLNFIPIASFSFVIFIASWAVLSLPFLVISEMLPQKLKNLGISFCMTVLWCSAFLVIKFLPFMTESLGFHGTMFFFAAICISSAIFIILYMPETKGKTYDEIMRALE